jgi:hypothetical protein
MTEPRARVLGSFIEGWRRVFKAPMVTLGVLTATALFALPFALTVGDAIESHLGSSLEAGRAADGWNAEWAAEFAAESDGVAATFTHEILGFGATLAIASDLADGVPLPPAVAAAALGYVGLWVFLSGGILDRFARCRPIRSAAFFAASGVFFFRFLRLAAVVGLAYWALFRWLHPWLFVTVYDGLTRDLTVEGQAVWLRAGLYLSFFGVLALVNLVSDFAKVRAVVEDRRSMLGALSASIRFMRRRGPRVLGLYAVNLLALAGLLLLWRGVAPGAGVPVWSALLITQVYLLCRLWAKLAFMASEVAFFQAELAHAGYAAAPLPIWPDSPAAEAIDNLSRERRSGSPPVR